VSIVNQKAALVFGALAGAAAAALLGRRRPRTLAGAAPPVDPHADELRRKLDEARQADVDESEFNVAGMAAETIVPDEPGRRDPSPANEFEAMRQRVHEEARAAAEEMRRQAETDA
jgi:hypothetical protein